VSQCSRTGCDLLSLRASLHKREHPSTEQIDAGAAIHSTFKHLQSVDLALCLSILQGSRTALVTAAISCGTALENRRIP
jgi:hypothetical protein